MLVKQKEEKHDIICNRLLEKSILGNGHFYCQVPGQKETVLGMKTAAAGTPGYEIHRTSKTGV